VEPTIAGRPCNYRAMHGAGLLVLFLLTLHSPPLAHWPWHLLVPLLAYFTLVRLSGPLRRTGPHFAVGRCDWRVLAATSGIVVLSSLALLAYQAAIQPDVRDLAAHVPGTVLGSAVLAGAYFSILNAVMEEVMFRGVLYDAVESQWGWMGAILLTGAAFGACHAGGYPQGLLGGVLAGIYGFVLGWLRWWTRGLAAPTAAHIMADATIFAILATSVG
jgi:uncharacterized protein